MAGLLSKERIVAKPGFNRWLVPPASIAIHLCIGSVYAWSIFNPALIKAYGVVTPTSGDWSLKDVVWIFTVANPLRGTDSKEIVYGGPIIERKNRCQAGF